MPVKSKKQYNFMRAASAKGLPGIDKETAQEFIKKTPKKKRSMFSKGKD